MFSKFKRKAIKLITFLFGCLGVMGFLATENPTPAQAVSANIATTEIVSTLATVENNEGLKISSDTAYDGTFKGIFNGDTTLNFYFAEPHEGWYAGNFVFRVTDAADATKYFDVEYKSVHTWASGTYTQIGHTNACVKYGSEVRTSKQTGKTWYNQEVTGGTADSNGVICAPSMTLNAAYTQVGILKLGYDTNGNFTVKTNKQRTADMRIIAAFDGTETFVDQESWGLPEMPFENGYKISFSSEFTSTKTTDKSTDVLFKSINNGGVTYDLTTETITTPEFYSDYMSACDITIAEHEDFNGYTMGREIVVPTATYTSMSVTQPTAVTDIKIQLPSGEKETVTAGQKYTVKQVGTHTVIYTVGESVATFEFTTLKYKSYYATDLFTVETSEATISQNGGVRISSDVEYNGAFKGVFGGNTTLKFNFPETYDGWYGGNFVIRVTDALDETKYFDVEYRVLSTWESTTAGGTIGYTGVYVNHDGNIRSARYYGDVWYDNYKTNAETANYAPAFRNYRAQDGILQLVYEEGKLAVKVNKHNSADVKTIAVFDGTKTFKDQVSWGLPEMPFANGYTLSFSSSFSNAKTEDTGTDVCFKQVITEGTTYDLTSTKFIQTDYSFDLEIGNTTKTNGEFYIPCKDEIGEVIGTYTIAFNGGAWKILKNVTLNVTADTSTVGEKTLVVTDDALVSEWEAIETNYTLHVENAYQITFDVNGGDQIDSISYSENTTNRVVIEDATKLFWVFDGWYIGEEAWSGDVTDLYGRNVTLTAHWKDVEAPILALANDIKSVTVVAIGTQTTISTADVKASDAAQPDSVSVSIEIKNGDGAWLPVNGSIVMDWTTVGMYYVRYTAQDAAGHTSQIERSIQIIERTSPTLTPAGVYVKNATIGETVKLATVSAVDADGKNLTVSVTIVKDGATIDVTDDMFIPTEEGCYTVTYTAIDEFEYQGIFSYEINVIKDLIAPTIMVDFADSQVEIGTTISIPTAAATDNVTKTLVVDVKVMYGTEEIAMANNEFVAEKAGVYSVVYSTADEAGNVVEKRVQITANDSVEQSPTTSTKNPISGCGSIIGGGSVIGSFAMFGVGLFINKNKNNKKKEKKL